MTDLKRARAHLLECQRQLFVWRSCNRIAHPQMQENAVLAALSWVWEEQEKARQAEIAEGDRIP